MGWVLSDRDMGRVSRVVQRVEGKAEGGYRRGADVSLIPFEFCRFELKTEWEAVGDSDVKRCDAYIVVGDADGDEYKRLMRSDKEPAVFELTDPLGTFGGTAASNSETTDEIDGTVGLCWNPHDCPNWEVVAGDTGLHPAILIDDCAPGDTALAAYPVSDDLTADTSATELSLDNTFPGNFRGYGADHTGFDETTGAKVLYASIGGVNQIVGGQHLSLTCRAKTKAAVATGDGSFVVDHVVPMEPGAQSPVASDTEELTVTNDGAKIAIDTTGTIIWDEGITGYRFLDFKHVC